MIYLKLDQDKRNLEVNIKIQLKILNSKNYQYYITFYRLLRKIRIFKI